jgi:AcrR family transcriptional regulator
VRRMRELKSIEEKILDRTLYLIGKRGTVNVPVRAIIQEADVNIGAINYYFGSKEKMLSHVKQFYIENIMSTIAPLDDESLDDQQKLIHYANEVMEYYIRFPGVTVILKYAYETKEHDEMSQKIINSELLMENKMEKVLERYLDEDEEKFKIKKMIFMSSIIYPTHDYTEMNEESDILHDYNKRIGYIEKVVKLIGQKI